MSTRPGELFPDDDLTVDGARSVLQEVTSRRRARRRRRLRPAWMLSAVRTVSRLRLIITRTIPEWARLHRQHLMTASISFVLHLMIAILMTLWMLPEDPTRWMSTLMAVPVPKEEVQAVELVEVVQPALLDEQEFENTVQQVLEVFDDTTRDLAAVDAGKDFELDLEPTQQDLASLAKLGEFGGRSSLGKQAAIRKYGGTAESERAVNLGLKWLRKIQQADGSWSFRQAGKEARNGRLRSTTMGSTSLALLCFMGAGHTHLSYGEYRTVVSGGLNYLTKNASGDRTSADMRGDYEGNSGMYVQGLATICLCEAYALEPKDYRLKKLARRAVRFIEKTQDKRGGGWRYEPGQPGDTSVVGWQVMALQSAKAGDISVSGQTGRGVRHFLDSAQTNNGERYAYMPDGGASPAMTSVGLLCRMYMGWRRDHSSLRRGVGYLSALGPHGEDMYYNYYATQVIHHWGGNEWRKWNTVMREQLVSRQITEGPATGSWAPRDPHAGSGGQIYETALSLLTLEIYYRYLPIYRQIED
ncbi:MAG: terpene cyclase/mutase family protein [Fuerstiella sp.]|nr:terpene cyclase/mutase family protein [Fuerstiella sp.]